MCRSNATMTLSSPHSAGCPTDTGSWALPPPPESAYPASWAHPPGTPQLPGPSIKNTKSVSPQSAEPPAPAVSEAKRQGRQQVVFASGHFLLIQLRCHPPPCSSPITQAVRRGWHPEGSSHFSLLPPASPSTPRSPGRVEYQSRGALGPQGPSWQGSGWSPVPSLR